MELGRRAAGEPIIYIHVALSNNLYGAVCGVVRAAAVRAETAFSRHADETAVTERSWVHEVPGGRVDVGK